MTTKIAVFASGSGSNFEALAKSIQSGELNAKIELVVTDKPGAYVVTRAQNLGIPVVELAPKSFENKAAYEAQVVELLKERDIEWVILAGYMRLIGDTLLSAYENRIINIHPSLLPSFPGKDAIGQAMEHGVKITGVTVHYVDAGMDTGKIIAQAAVDVVDADRVATEERIHKTEHALYTKTLQQLFES